MAAATNAARFRIDLVNMCLWRSNGAAPEEPLKLPPKTFDLLRYLVDNAGRWVTHDELLSALWGDIHVQPEVLKSHIHAIRNALGDDSVDPHFIQTQRGRGYRLIGLISAGGAATPSPAAPAKTPLLVGRDDPLQKLHQLLRLAAAGERQAAFVNGEPGIGKTALVRRFVAEARQYSNLVVAEGHCIEGFGGIEPYYSVLEALSGLCGGVSRAATIRTLVTLAPVWASQISHIPRDQRVGVALPIDGARARMVREGVGLLEALAGEQTLLLVLEDLHWADYATVDLLSALCRRQSVARLMLIVTYRNEELGDARHPLQQMAHELAAHKFCREVTLGPLAEPAIGQFLAGGADACPASEAFTRFIRDRSGGNPLFVELILEFLQERGLVEPAGRGWRLLRPIDESAFVTPPTLGRILETKISAMNHEARLALEAASVVGLRFDPAISAGAAGIDAQAFEVICEELSRHSLIIQRDDPLVLADGELVPTYVFKHAVFRQVFYDRIGQLRRTRLHRAIGDRLEGTYPPEKRADFAMLLAQHFEAARDWPRAIDYLRTALRVANSRFARRDALAIIERASMLAAHLPDGIPIELEFLERRGALLAAAHDSRAHEVASRFVATARRHDDVEILCRALVGMAYVTSWHDLGGSIRFLDEVIILSERLTDPVKRDIARMSAYIRRLWGAGWNRAEAAQCAEILKRLEGAADPLTIARARINFSMLCMVSARYQEARDLVDGNFQLLRGSPLNIVEIDIARAVWMRHVGVPWALFSLGQFGAALHEFETSLATFEKENDRPVVLSYQIYRGVLRFHAFDFEGVLSDCEPVAQLLSEPDACAIRILPVDRRIALIFCGLAKAALGNSAAALMDLRTAHDEMESKPAHLDWYWRLPLEWGMVGLLISIGDDAEAIARAMRFIDLVGQTDERTWQALAYEAGARAVLAGGNTARAIDLVAKAVAICAEADIPLAELRVHATSAMIWMAEKDTRRAKQHIARGETVRLRIASSLPDRHAIRLQFERRSQQLLPI